MPWHTRAILIKACDDQNGYDKLNYKAHMFSILIMIQLRIDVVGQYHVYMEQWISQTSLFLTFCFRNTLMLICFTFITNTCFMHLIKFTIFVSISMCKVFFCCLYIVVFLFVSDICYSLLDITSLIWCNSFYDNIHDCIVHHISIPLIH